MEVYLDNAATTKPAEEVVDVMVKSLKEMYGNPSSLHRKGVEVEREIKKVRKLVAKALGCNEKEVIFTSGGTEANNLAIRGLVKAHSRKGNHLITSKIEHKSVLSLLQQLEEEGFEVTYLDVDEKGFISLEKLEKAVKENTILVSVMHVNNEVGSVQPIKEITKIVRQKNPNTRIHIDGVQSFGKIKYFVKDLEIDSLSISAHKFHGPKGIGALYLRNSVRMIPLLVGGGQELELRAGTENVPGIFGLGEAVRLLLEEQDKKINEIKNLKKHLLRRLREKLEDIYIATEEDDQYAPHIINVSLKGVRSEIMLHSLESDGIYISSGSACSSKKRGYSHVLEAMGMRESHIDSAIRISLSHTNTVEEIDYAVDSIKRHLNSLRKIIRR
ncbi:cysteine desulfurase family protein [Clostridium formicaceticum]|uniref:Cysteine desulfurase n=1 Tax=Clostridium formicaceticum TaxID=1497 RepID=A0AAC9WFR9_9CLOT|nr:cysteine desulfurase family protein [Clostridium formicaceticum]AOY76756.1 cysteine desulfurase NifS [Clostridium formicaceticum]ARE87207.1 Cysteine desulfurase [Clostridium formicaceticum]